MREHRIGVIGLGVWGCHALEQFLTATGRARVTRITADPAFGYHSLGADWMERFRQTAAKLGAVPTADYRELLADPDIDVVSLMVAPKHKPALMAEALRAGKKIVTDKPLARHADDLSVVAAVPGFNPDDVFVLAGYWARPGVDRVVAAAVEGKLGRLRGATLRLYFMGGVFPGFVPTPQWASEIPGGELATIGSHLLATLLKITGPEDFRVAAVRRNWFYERYREVGVEDWADLLLEGPDGLVASLSTGRLPQPRPNDGLFLELVGTEGYACFEKQRYEIRTASGKETGGSEAEPHKNFDSASVIRTFHQLLDDWENGRSVSFNYHFGRQMQEILDAAREGADASRASGLRC